MVRGKTKQLPDKSIASLVKFYYSWKKTRSRTSVMDRQEKMKKNDSSENGSDHGSNEESDNDDKPSSNSVAAAGTNSGSGGNSNPNISSSGSGGGNGKTNETENESNGSSGIGGATNEGSLNCAGCGVTCSEVHPSSHGKLCGSCHHHWRRTGVLRPTTGPSFMNKRTRGSNILGKSGDSHKRRPPKGMYINHDDIVKLASTAQNDDGAGGTVGSDGGGGRKGNQNNDLLASMDREIVSLLTQIQKNKQKSSGLKRKIDDMLEELNPPEVSSVRLNSRWNNEELMLAVQGVRMYGRDFQAIADALGTKTETQVRTFFINYRRRFNLDAVLKEFEATNAKKAPEIMSNNNNNNRANNSGTKESFDQSKANSSEMLIADTGKPIDSVTTGTGDVEDKDPENRPVEKDKPEKSVSPGGEFEIMEIDLVDDDNNRVAAATANGKSAKDAPDSVMIDSNNIIDDDTSINNLESVSVNSLSAAIALDSSLSMDVDEVTITPSIKNSDAVDASNTVIIQ
uniref:SANT domain-containing protein n=1 Tax=Anopheles epiroticus TaxID=199890 RepID=A0A182P993_9DIPT